ncbi:MAG: hypothetical protein ACRD3W_24900 [Terriglobales bacterium]
MSGGQRCLLKSDEVIIIQRVLLERGSLGGLRIFRDGEYYEATLLSWHHKEFCHSGAVGVLAG